MDSATSVNASIGMQAPVKKKTYGIKSDFGILEEEVPNRANKDTILSTRTAIPGAVLSP